MSKTFVFVLDFTYDGQKVKALEMGDFFKSGLTGLNRLRQQEKKQSIEEEYLQRLEKRYSQAIYLEDESSPFTRALTFHDFTNGNSARCNFKRDSLIPSLLYSRAQLGSQTYFEKPLVVSLTTTAFPPTYRIPLANLLKEQQNTFDILNYPEGVLIDACQDKVVFHRFMKETDLCPPTILIDLTNSDLTELNRFIAINASSHYVVKPTNLSMGRGVEVLEQGEKLVTFVKRLQQITERSSHRYENSELISEWTYAIVHKQSPFAIIQSCCPSKEIAIDTHTYRPTGRVVIEATFSEDPSSLPTLDFLGSYWKFPKTCSDSISTTSLKSHVDEDSKITVIAEEDWQEIEAQLNLQLPQVLSRLYSTDFDKLADHFTSTPALVHYQQQLGIDEASRQSYQQTPKSTQALSCFEEFTYGGPGFNKHLNSFKYSFCYPNPSSVEEEKTTKTKDPIANSQQNTFFNVSPTPIKKPVQLENLDLGGISFCSLF